MLENILSFGFFSPEYNGANDIKRLEYSNPEFGRDTEKLITVFMFAFKIFILYTLVKSKRLKEYFNKKWLNS